MFQESYWHFYEDVELQASDCSWSFRWYWRWWARMSASGHVLWYSWMLVCTTAMANGGENPQGRLAPMSQWILTGFTFAIKGWGHSTIGLEVARSFWGWVRLLYLRLSSSAFGGRYTILKQILNEVPKWRVASRRHTNDRFDASSARTHYTV